MFIRWVRRLPLSLWLLLGLVFLLYLPSLWYPFVSWDDELLVTRNAILRLPFLHMVGKAFTSFDPELYAPLTTFSYGLQYTFFGLWAPAYHAFSLLIHVVNVGLVFLIVDRLTSRRRWALLCAFLWAIHPLNVETVAWISARKDLLAACFALGSLLAYVHGRKGISVVFYILGLLSKVSIVPLPLFFLLVDRYHGVPFRRSLRSQLPSLLLACAFIMIALVGKTRNIVSLSWTDTALLSVQSLWFYLWKVLIPLRLSILYPVPLPVSSSDPAVLLSLVFIIAALGCMAWAWRKRSYFVLLACAWYVLFLLPSFASFVRAGRVSVAVDHYAYLAIIGPLFLASGALDRFLDIRRAVARTAVVVIGAGLLFAGYVRMTDWRSSEALYASALRLSPGEAVLRYNLGVEYSVQGRWDEAVAAYRQAIEADPAYDDAMSNLAALLSGRGEKDEARTLLERAIAINPKNANAYNNRGSIRLDAGDIDAAIDDFKKAVALDERNIRAHQNLGTSYGKKGMYREGLLEFRRALELDPNADPREIGKINDALRAQ